MRVLPVLGAWLVAGVAALLVASTSALGPTLVMVSSRRGAQAGDLAFTLAAAGGAALVTRAWSLSGTEARLLLAAVTWLTAGAVSVFIAATTEVGPTVLRLSEGHGVHSGDVVVTLGAAAGATLVTSALLAWDRSRDLPARDRRP